MADGTSLLPEVQGSARANPRPALRGADTNLRRALAQYRSVRFTIAAGVRSYFEAKEAARAGVYAAIEAARRVAS